MKRLLDQDPQREAARQRRLLDVADRRFSRMFRAEIKRAMLDMVARFQSMRAIPDLPVDHERRIAAVFDDMAGVVVPAFAGRILDQGKALGFRLERKEGWSEFFLRLALEYLQQELIRARITAISETTRANIVAAIERGERDGLGVDAIADLIREQVDGISRYRAHVIARTETHGAANYATHNAAKATGLKLRREWISVEDYRTRDFGEGDGVADEFDHRAMNGQTVEMDEPFLMPWRRGEPVPCQFPGDPTLPVGGIVNCRCAQGFIVDDSF